MFQFQCAYECEDLVSLNRVVSKAYRRWLTRITNILWLLIGGSDLLAAGFLIHLQGKSAFPVALIALVIGALLCASPFLRHRLAAWQSRRMLLKDTGELTVVLDEEGLREHSLKGEGFYPWKGFIDVYRSRGSYLLFLDKKHALILPRRVIPEETVAPLERFLAEKFGTEIKEIH